MQLQSSPSGDQLHFRVHRLGISFSYKVHRLESIRKDNLGDKTVSPSRDHQESFTVKKSPGKFHRLKIARKVSPSRDHQESFTV